MPGSLGAWEPGNQYDIKVCREYSVSLLYQNFYKIDRPQKTGIIG